MLWTLSKYHTALYFENREFYELLMTKMQNPKHQLMLSVDFDGYTRFIPDYYLRCSNIWGIELINFPETPLGFPPETDSPPKLSNIFYLRFQNGRLLTAPELENITHIKITDCPNLSIDVAGSLSTLESFNLTTETIRSCKSLERCANLKGFSLSNNYHMLADPSLVATFRNVILLSIDDVSDRNLFKAQNQPAGQFKMRTIYLYLPFLRVLRWYDLLIDPTSYFPCLESLVGYFEDPMELPPEFYEMILRQCKFSIRRLEFENVSNLSPEFLTSFPLLRVLRRSFCGSNKSYCGSCGKIEILTLPSQLKALSLIAETDQRIQTIPHQYQSQQHRYFAPHSQQILDPLQKKRTKPQISELQIELTDRLAASIFNLFDLRCLTELRLDFTNVEDISSFIHVPYLSLASCHEIKDFSCLADPATRVRFLNLTCSKALRDEDVQYLSNIPSLVLDYCFNIQDISPLRNNRYLSLQYCGKLSMFCHLHGFYRKVTFRSRCFTEFVLAVHGHIEELHRSAPPYVRVPKQYGSRVWHQIIHEENQED